MTERDLRPGDLIFQEHGDTAFSAAVSAVVRGWNKRPIYHVGLYEGDGWVWEASREGVRRTALSTWNGGLLCGRLLSRWHQSPAGLVPRALAWIRKQEGLPYNDTFDQTKTSFYCSELIIDAFRHGGAPVFAESPLVFRDPATGELLSYWVQYYRERGLAIPEGLPGSHPATLSLSDQLSIEPLTTEN